MDAGQTSHASIPESEMFLRRHGGKVALIKGEFLDNLEEFEGLPLREQRKMLTNDILKVRMHLGCLWWHVSSVSECAFRRVWCSPGDM